MNKDTKVVVDQVVEQLLDELVKSRQLIASLKSELNDTIIKYSIQDHRFEKLAFESASNDYRIKQQQIIIDKQRNNEALLMQEIEILSEKIAKLLDEFKSKENMYDLVSHDIRSAVVTWLNTTELLLTEVGISPTGLQILEEARASGLTILGYIDTHLSVSRIECGGLEVEFAPVNAVDLVMSVISQNRKLINEKKLSLPPPVGVHGEVAKSCSIYCCSSMAYVMLNNLLVNAIEASPAGAEIKVTFENNDHCKISIHNFGEVPEKIRDVFFDKFVTSGKRNGTGIGTYSAMLMARAQNGDILADFSEPGATTVTVIFQKPPMA